MITKSQLTAAYKARLKQWKEFWMDSLNKKPWPANMGETKRSIYGPKPR